MDTFHSDQLTYWRRPDVAARDVPGPVTHLQAGVEDRSRCTVEGHPATVVTLEELGAVGRVADMPAQDLAVLVGSLR